MSFVIIHGINDLNCCLILIRFMYIFFFIKENKYFLVNNDCFKDFGLKRFLLMMSVHSFNSEIATYYYYYVLFFTL